MIQESLVAQGPQTLLLKPLRHKAGQENQG